MKRNSRKIRFDIVTLFPKIFDSYLNESILKRAATKGVLEVHTHNIRDFSRDKHHKVDHPPYGGGAGMVLAALPILRAAERILSKNKKTKTKIVILSAKGKAFNQKVAYDWARKYEHIMLISGRYEGIDERVKRVLKAEEVSIGPYVTTDGDVAAMVLVSAVTRLIPGAIKLESLEEESHWNLVLKKEKNAIGESGREYPHYTRPEVFTWPEGKGKRAKKYSVPKILLSGDHRKIEQWRKARR